MRVLAFGLVLLFGAHANEVAESGSGVVAEACEEDLSLEESFSTETCLKYKDVEYVSDNRNPKPKWIMEPYPNVTRVLLRRMRKAGSTTVEKFLQKARQLHQRFEREQMQEGNQVAFVGYDAMEYESMNIQCVLGPNAPLTPANRAILVTHFRYPIDRINSEYWSEGPGNRLKIADEETWREWMAFTPRRHKQNVGVSYEPGLYTNNYYVRLLTGNCGDCHLRTVKKPHKSDIGMAQGCKATSDYYKYATVDMALYCKAIEMASAFQIIVIAEYYDKLSMNALLRRQFEQLTHMPRGSLDDLTLGHERNHLKDAPVPIPQYRTIPPPAIVEELKKDNVFDLQLYEWAKAKVDAQLAAFE